MIEIDDDFSLNIDADSADESLYALDSSLKPDDSIAKKQSTNSGFMEVQRYNPSLKSAEKDATISTTIKKELKPSRLISSTNQQSVSSLKENPAAETGLTSSKTRQLPVEDDPMQYHTRPRDLSKDSLKQARELPKSIATHIFSRVPFSEARLDQRLIDVLEGSSDHGGLGLASSTRVQSVSVPILAQRHNVLMKSQTGSGKTLAYLM